VFVPLDLPCRLVVRVSYRPFIAGWIAGLVCLLAPIDRWLVQAHSHTCEDAAVRRACRVAIRAPRRFSPRGLASWVVPFALLDAILAVPPQSWFPLGLHTSSGSLLMGGAVLAASFCLARTFLSWYRGPTMGRLSLAAHARGLSLPLEPPTSPRVVGTDGQEQSAA
jgi:hypothetical protein